MGFYDSKGYFRNDGDGFYDAKGYFRNPGEGFYDSKGYFRNPGDGFYDAKGYWVNPGGNFYDSKGYCRAAVVATTTTSGDGYGLLAFIGFVLFIPIALIWGMTTFVIEWITMHIYIVYFGYLILTAVVCGVITKIKRHRKGKFLLSYIGNYICVLSFVYVTLLYSVPYVVINDGSFDSFFEFTLVSAFAVGGIAVVQLFNYYHEKAIWECILGILFFIIVIIMLRNGTKDMNTLESLADIYNIKNMLPFRILFSFAIP